MSDVVLPPREFATELSERYFFVVFPVYPFVHWTSFVAELDALYAAYERPGSDTAEPPRPFFYCLVNVVFAISTQFCTSIPADEREALSVMFYQRAWDLLDLRVLCTHVDVELVQVLLISTKCLQATHEPNQCWHVLALAVRMAQSCGLHVDPVELGETDFVTINLRRRLWWGCVVIDKLLAVSLGRPTMIASEKFDVKLPVPAKDEDIEAHTRLDADHLVPVWRRMEYFACSIKMHTIAFCAAEDLYLRPASKASTDCREVELMFEHLQRLTEWLTSIPEYFKSEPPVGLEDPPASVDNDGKPDSVLTMLSRVLRLRYLQTQILVLRPSLTHMIRAQMRGDSEGDGSSPVAQMSWLAYTHFAYLCSESAMDLIQGVYDSLNTGPGVGAAWWYNLYYLYTASTILLAAHLVPGVSDMLDQNRVARSWTMVEEVMGTLQSTTKSAKRYMDYLMRMRELIMSINTSSEPVVMMTARSAAPNSGSANSATSVASPGGRSNIYNLIEQTGTPYFPFFFFQKQIKAKHSLKNTN